MHDVLDDRDLIPDEAEQLATSGYQAGSLLEQARVASRAGDRPRLAEMEGQLAAATREPGWRYNEPGADELAALAEITALAERSLRLAERSGAKVAL